MENIYKEKVDSLWEEIRTFIISKIKEFGTESQHSNLKVIKVDYDRSINLESGRYLHELSEDNLIDNNGYLYGYGVLDHEQLSELADWINQNYN